MCVVDSFVNYTVGAVDYIAGGPEFGCEVFVSRRTLRDARRVVLF